MALLQPPKPLQIASNLFPICNFSSIRPSISIPFSSSKTHHQNALLSSSTTSRTFSLSTSPRRILCEPPKGKYIHDDYLVVHLRFLLPLLLIFFDFRLWVCYCFCLSIVLMSVLLAEEDDGCRSAGVSEGGKKCAAYN